MAERTLQRDLVELFDCGYTLAQMCVRGSMDSEDPRDRDCSTPIKRDENSVNGYMDKYYRDKDENKAALIRECLATGSTAKLQEVVNTVRKEQQDRHEVWLGTVRDSADKALSALLE